MLYLHVITCGQQRYMQLLLLLLCNSILLFVF
jgi:hypothetical protein